MPSIISYVKIFVLLLMFVASLVFSSPNKQLPDEEVGPWIVNVYYDDLSELKKYTKNNRPWKIEEQDNYFIIGVDNIVEYQQLLDMGFTVEINTKLTDSTSVVKETIEKANSRGIELGSDTIPGFACFRTVEATFESMDNLEQNYPTLASVVDIGNSWNKVDSGGTEGYDMRVLKITNSAITGDKPILYAMSSIHAREYAPAELNMRFAEYLLNNYGTDADATWLVDHREIHLLIQGNPDSRKVAETGVLKRKNQNNNYCTNNVDRGVDMNRNFEFKWDDGTGSSNNVCSEVYHGPNALSEPETESINTYIKTLFDDQRDDDLIDVAPADTTGLYLDIHNFASLILFPFGYSDGAAQAPNHVQLQTLGRKFGWYNGYRAEQSNSSLGGADGASDDNAYGQLGVASYTFELGGSGFFTPCATFENSVYPGNLPALVYAAKVADTPYITASGPDLENIIFSGYDVTAGTMIQVSGVASDVHFNNNNGTEPTQNINSVQMFVDQLPWDNASTPILTIATDGIFNSSIEQFESQINTTGLSIGQHIVYFISTDGSAVTGVPYAKFFNIVDPADIGTVSGVITDANTNSAISGVNVILESLQTTTDSNGNYSFEVIAGDYSLTASKPTYATATFDNLMVTGTQITTQDIQLQPLCSLMDENVDSFNSISDAETVGWSHGRNVGTDDWGIDLLEGISNSHSFNTTDAGTLTDKFLISPSFALSSGSSLEFWHKYVFEGNTTYYDGSVLEISTNSGTSWQDLGTHITTGGYNATLSSGNALGNRPGWGGSSPSYSKVEVDLASFAGQTVQFRWRFGADTNTSAGDWNIDDIKVLDPSACSNNDVIFSSGFELVLP